MSALALSMVLVAAGTYHPVFPVSPSQAEVPVAAFLLDPVPVTNGKYLAFVRAHPEWRRDRVAPVLAEPGYLAHWRAPDEVDPEDLEQPVVSVSWFAARAYCAARGARLPTEAEWELAASASATKADASADPAFRAARLALMLRPAPARLPPVGSGPANFWGIRGLEGPTWEWVVDFGNAKLALAASGGGARFCGAGAVAAQDKTDLAAFERVAFRSSLHASYHTKYLTFRCAADAPDHGGSR